MCIRIVVSVFILIRPHIIITRCIIVMVEKGFQIDGPFATVGVWQVTATENHSRMLKLL